jgi:two-component system sensor histidine kinase MprB
MMRRASIRTRLTLIAAAAVTTVALLVGGLAWLVLRQSLMHQVDAEMQTMAQGPVRYLDPDMIATIPTTPLTPPTGIHIQVLLPDGRTVTAPQDTPHLPLTDQDRAVAAGTTTQARYTLVTDHARFRVLTVRGARGQTVQLGRSLADVDATLQTAAILMAALVAGATAAAALAGRLVARTGLRPIERLTHAATNVADTRDLTHPIPVDGHDEVAQLGHAFNQMLTALDQSQRAQRELIEDAAHELRTPMSSLRTNVELLIHAGTRLSAADRQSLLSDLHGQSIELSDLVSDLLELSRSGSADEPAEPVDLPYLVTEAIDRARTRCAHARFATHDPQAIVVNAQPNRLQRALVNLLDNAVKFGPTDQTIDIHISTTGTGRARVAEISVADRAPAIPESEQERIFHRFHRLDTTRGVPGAGLGLAIVHQTATAHGGTVTVEPRPGGGNIFRLRLPAPDPSQSTARTAAAPTGAHAPRTVQPSG